MNILDIAIAKKLAGGGGGSGTDNYNDLSNLPKINDTTLSGNKSSSALGLQSEINSDSKLASDLVDDTNQDNKFVTSTEKNTWNGKQNAIDADHKINADYVDDSTSTNKFVTASDKETWNAKQNAIDNSHKLSSDLVDDANHTNKFVTSSEKQTWNNKQNAIDADHKLSSSLVSFTTAEAAALASGIDSNKVGQISTNQTNILYGLNKVGKNLINTFDLDTIKEFNVTGTWSGNEYARGNARFTVKADGTIGVKTVAQTSGDSMFYLPVPVMENNGSYMLSGCPEGGSGAATNGYLLDYQYLRDGNTIYIIDTGDSHSFTYKTTDTAQQLVVIVRNQTTISSEIIFKPMICLKTIYDADPTYSHSALPNYDLTRLQAEDRAGLVECVDGGAKNLYDLSDANVAYNRGMSTRTITSSTGTIALTSDGTLSWSRVGMKVTLPAGSYVYSGKITTAATNGKITSSTDINDSAQGTEVFNSITANTTKSFDVAFTLNSQTTFYIFYYTNFVESTTAASITVANNMLCTKAAFCLSNKFVPYRPNYDLVAADHVTLNTDTLILRQTLQYGTDFNNILTSGFYKYNGGPANTPNHGSGDFGMLLVMRSGNYISQICHQFNGDIHLYVRQSTDNGSTWGAWTS